MLLKCQQLSCNRFTKKCASKTAGHLLSYTIIMSFCILLISGCVTPQNKCELSLVLVFGDLKITKEPTEEQLKDDWIFDPNVLAQDSILLFFENGYDHNTLTVQVDDTTFESPPLTTDPGLGLAGSMWLTNDRAQRQVTVRLDNQREWTFIMHGLYPYIYINLRNSQGQLHLYYSSVKRLYL